jgi:hypothetical protein
MIPQLSPIPYPAGFVTKQGKRTIPLQAWCTGDTDIGAVVQLDGTQWRLDYTDPEFRITRETDGYSVVPYSHAGAVWVSFAFDQAMQPAFVWQDSSAVIRIAYFFGSSYTTSVIAAGITPLIILDEVRLSQQSNSDLIVSYIRDTNLYARVQRESYATERLLATAAGRSLVSFGRNRGSRLQWRLLPLTV